MGVYGFHDYSRAQGSDVFLSTNVDRKSIIAV